MMMMILKSWLRCACSVSVIHKRFCTIMSSMTPKNTETVLLKIDFRVYLFPLFNAEKHCKQFTNA